MTDSHAEFDRRHFAACVAAAAAALGTAAAGAAAAHDQPAASKKDGDDKPDKPPAEKPAPEKPAPPFNPIALQLELLVHQYPSDELTPDGLRIIAGKLAGQLAHSARLSSFPLANADGPGFVFSAYRQHAR